jgi:hypothetical protein
LYGSFSNDWCWKMCGCDCHKKNLWWSTKITPGVNLGAVIDKESRMNWKIYACRKRRRQIQVDLEEIRVGKRRRTAVQLLSTCNARNECCQKKKSSTSSFNIKRTTLQEALAIEKC